MSDIDFIFILVKIKVKDMPHFCLYALYIHMEYLVRYSYGIWHAVYVCYSVL